MADVARTTLYQIETGLQELIEYRESEELTAEERAVVDSQIAEYVSRELTKVDSIRGYLRHCDMMKREAEAEAARCKTIAGIWENRGTLLKDLCKGLMESLGNKRIEGRSGYLLLKGNGGKQAVEVYDEKLIPDDLCEYEGRISGHAWDNLRLIMVQSEEGRRTWEIWSGRQDVQMQRIPHKGRIGQELESGHVPGARLVPRGSHIEIK
jgi:hypothetical protein